MMKTNLVPRCVRWFLLATLSLATLDTWARPPRAREACGVLQNIDAQALTLTLAQEKGDRPIEAVWRRDTKVLKNWKFASTDALQQGVRACVFYRSPFFGKPFVTKVILN
jgi:hypothetical protein